MSNQLSAHAPAALPTTPTGSSLQVRKRLRTQLAAAALRP